MWIAIGVSVILALVCLALAVRLILFRHSIREIDAALDFVLSEDTNACISVSTRDKTVLRFVGNLNKKLETLRSQEIKYTSGDHEIKETIADVSHDLRTPLTAICGYLELMEDEEKSEKLERYLAAVKERADALKSLTEELFRYSMAVSSEDAPALNQIKLNDILEDALVGMYAAFSERGIIPEITMPDSGVYVIADKETLARAINNILNNALKYSDGDLSVTLTADGSMTFANTASSLSETDAARLFERFYTVGRERKSSGLGLTIAKAFVERSGGTIRAAYHGGRLSIIIGLPVAPFASISG